MFKQKTINLNVDNRLINKYFLVATLILFTFAAYHVYGTWKELSNKQYSSVYNLAKATAAFISPDLITSVSKTNNVNLDQKYNFLKNSLSDVQQSIPAVSSTYILFPKNGKIIYLADTENHEQLKTETQDSIYPTERAGFVLSLFKTKIFSPEEAIDHREDITSVYAPVWDISNRDVVAIIGLDYRTKDLTSEVFRHVISSTMAVLVLFLLLFALYILVLARFNKNHIDEKFEMSQNLLRNVFHRIPEGIAVGRKFGDFSVINPTFEKILGWTNEQLLVTGWQELTHPDDLTRNIEEYEMFKRGEINEYSIEKRMLKPDGLYSWINMGVASLNQADKGQGVNVWIIQDINERKLEREALEESERSKSVLLANLPGMAYRCINNRDWTMLFVSERCYELTGYTSKDFLKSKSVIFNEIIKEEHREILWLEWQNAIALHSTLRTEYEIITASGETKWVLESGQGVYDENGEIEAIEGIIIDISQQKRKEEELQYISDHDNLTDLYNRQYIDKILLKMDVPESLPLSLLVADINGLHLINEAFGDSEGDLVIKKAARIIQSCCLGNYILARVAGDEFGIIMPNTDNSAAHGLIKKIKEALVVYNKNNKPQSSEINISMGYATKEDANEHIEETLKKANDYLRNKKLLSQQSSYSGIISSIMTTVYEKSQETEKHAERLVELSTKVGRMLNLMEKDISELQLLGMLHDIGKIGIDDKILNKPGKLTEEEWVIMRTHPEIGYRIAKASHQLARISDYILTHHERWDGKGYPRGLKGEDIPLLSRILSVADAYDAMTEDRVYRKAMSKEQAIEEIRRNAGSQFDPTIAEMFIESVL